MIEIMRVSGSDAGVALPGYETAGAAGADLRANLPGATALTLAPGARMLVPTGLRMAIAAGFEVQIRPRSGLALKYGISLLNAPGTIDSDYRGEVGVILHNTSDAPFTITHAMRIAQMVIAPVCRADFVVVDRLDTTARGAGGFGSTGTGGMNSTGTGGIDPAGTGGRNSTGTGGIDPAGTGDINQTGTENTQTTGADQGGLRLSTSPPAKGQS